MSKVRRIYVEKKKDFAIAARQTFDEIKNYLGIGGVSGVRILIRYDVENISDETFGRALRTVFSEPPVDDVYNETVSDACGRMFSAEYLPGQFDQRADSAMQCIRLLDESENPIIRTATTYIVEGDISDEDFERIKSHFINPVDSRVASDEKPETLSIEYDAPKDVEIMLGFADMDENTLLGLYESLNLAMTFADFKFIQDYFKDEEKRDPTITEIRVLDTYWSDHCRHTTFGTELKRVMFDGGEENPVCGAYKDYLDVFDDVYKGRGDKFVCLMDMATLAAKKLKKEGKLDDQEESDEINACSIVVPIKVDDKEEEWLINFKNETHNHPTEIEPFGGAATCLGGAIRDPLSGRTYVYQAMRVTGAADPTRPLSDTMEGKLPQKKLVREAAHGYSSYGNQIGLATGFVREIYHPNYAAKRMEIGAVLGAAPRRAVKRLSSDPGDLIILLGGRTGRDGCGGATGSSKKHTTQSIETCGAEVQKGNAPTERKLQRLFRREEVSILIKKCNDFGAGGVSVAIGELADGLRIDLDKVPKKYEGLDGTELAISESQERMAVVVAPEDADKFMEYAHEENLEATVVAVVSKDPRIVMTWRGKEIVNLSRAFLGTNGAHQEAEVQVACPGEDVFADDIRNKDAREAAKNADMGAALLSTLSDLNVCSQKGLVEMFDGSIGAASIYMPHGGKFQLTPVQAMAAKVPVMTGKSDAATLMSYGFDPYLSEKSPYAGAIYAVIESVAKIVAAGGDPGKIRFTFQEYFGKVSKDPKSWSKPFSALLGAFEAQIGLGLPAIGGKDSMSGTFQDIDVPPTLVSFAVDMANTGDVITPEFKNAGDRIVQFTFDGAMFKNPDFDNFMEVFMFIHNEIMKGRIKAAYVVDAYGTAAAVAKMAFGNKLGVRLEANDPSRFFKEGYASIVCEMSDEDLAAVMEDLAADDSEMSACVIEDIGEVTDSGMLEIVGDEGVCSASVSVDEALGAWTGTLDKVFPSLPPKEDKSSVQDEKRAEETFKTDGVYICKHKVAKPMVFIPAFPGTNCEYDSAKAFEAAGADTCVRVFRNLSAEDIRASVDEYTEAIAHAQIVMFPGGFSAGDEPDGSAKFFAASFRNEKIKEAIMDLVTKRDGLVLGICNGFQALIKLGLVPWGEICDMTPDSPTLTFNTIGRHISRMVYTKVVSNKSPWLLGAEPGGVYVNPASHGEGRFVAPKDVIDRLFENEQVATRYCDPEGNITDNSEWNVNGSHMAIEGITSPDGRILGKMAHIERRGSRVAVNIYGEQDMKVFESGVMYFK